MNRKLKQLAALACVLLLLASLGIGAAAEYLKPYILNVFDNTALDITPYRGKTLVLHYFMESSPYCDGEMEKIKQMYGEYAQEDLQILLIHVWAAGENQENAQRVVEKHGLGALDLVFDQNEKIAEALGVPSCPFTVYIDNAGFLEDAIMFPIEYSQIQDILKHLGVRLAADVPAATADPTLDTPVASAAPEASQAPAAVDTAGTEAPAATAAPEATGGPQEAQTPSGIVIGTPAPKEGADGAQATEAPAATTTGGSSGGPPPGSKGVVSP